MEQLNGLKNFAVNIKPLMWKMQTARKPEKLTCAEMNQIVQYYLETIDFLGKVKS